MKTNLENNKIKNGFKTPINYFDTFSDKVFEKINNVETTNLYAKTSGFVVPENYFEKNELELLSIIKQPKTKIISLKNSLYKISAIAAIVLITIVLPILYNATEVKENTLAEMSYLETNIDEISDYEFALILNDKEINDLENELVYNALTNNTSTNN